MIEDFDEVASFSGNKGIIRRLLTVLAVPAIDGKLALQNNLFRNRLIFSFWICLMRNYSDDFFWHGIFSQPV